MQVLAEIGKLFVYSNARVIRPESNRPLSKPFSRSAIHQQGQRHSKQTAMTAAHGECTNHAGSMQAACQPGPTSIYWGPLGRGMLCSVPITARALTDFWKPIAPEMQNGTILGWACRRECLQYRKLIILHTHISGKALHFAKFISRTDPRQTVIASTSFCIYR